MSTSDLQHKSVIVTGAASGIGRAAALSFAAEGARVAVADLNAEAAEETVKLIAEAGGTAVAVRPHDANRIDEAAPTAPRR